MERDFFPVLVEMQKVIERNSELLKMMHKERASTHAMALTMYGSAGGYNRILRRLRGEILTSEFIPNTYPAETLVKRGRLLREKSAKIIETLQSDGVLTPFMVKRIAYKYAENEPFIRSIKDYLHSEVAHMICKMSRGW